MAFLINTKANYAFKSLLGKAHTSNVRELSNEAISSGIILSASRIFADPINPNPLSSQNAGIISDELVLVLEAVAGSDTNIPGTPQSYRCKLGAAVPASLAGKINPLTGNNYVPNDYVGNIVPQSFGDGFRPKLYSDTGATVEIPPSSAADWFIDCFAGIITQEGYDDGSAFNLGSNGRVRAFVYIGRFVKDALGSGGGSGGSGEWKDSIKGFSGDLVGGTNAFFNFYSTAALTPPSIDSSLLLNKLRWIHIGATVNGLNIYNPTTNTFSTGNIVNNDIVEYFVSQGTAGQIGYIKYTPTAGTFTSIDNIKTAIYRFDGTNWIDQEFEKTIPVEISLNLVTSVDNISGWQALSNNLLNDIQHLSASIAESTCYINGIKVGTDAVTFRTWTPTTDASASAFTNTSFNTASSYTIGEAIQVTVSANTYLVNVISIAGPVVTIGDNLGGTISAVAKIVTTLSNASNKTAKLFWNSNLAGYAVSPTIDGDTGTLLYYKIS